MGDFDELADFLSSAATDLLSLEDPTHHHYLKFCFVCQEETKAGQEHIRNYGGIVCFSCRAFFRRAHQKTRNPRFTCKHDNSCIVTFSNRRRCQKCRYEKCLLAGMKPELVLNEEQKLIRFRKLLHRKKKGSLKKNAGQTSKAGTTEEGATITSSSEEAGTSQPTSKNKRKSAQAIPLTSTTLTSPPLTSTTSTGTPPTPKMNKGIKDTMETVQTQFDDIALSCPKTEDLSDFDAILQHCQSRIKDEAFDLDLDELEMDQGQVQVPSQILERTKYIVESYKAAIRQGADERGDKYLGKLVSFHRGNLNVQISKKEVLNHFITLATIFNKFAFKQREFCQLSKSTQRDLLNRNSPLFIQLLTAQYFGADNGDEQLSSILEFYQHHAPSLAPRNWPAAYMNLDFFNRISKVFLQSDLSYFYSLIRAVRDMGFRGLESQALVAYLILFNQEQEGKSSEAFDSCAPTVEAIIEYFGKEQQPGFSPQDLTGTLVKMAIFASYNMDWEEEEKPPGPSSQVTVVMPYTQEEECWLQSQVNQVLAAYHTVPVGEELLDEFTMFSLGVPLSKSYLKSVMSIGLERVRRMFNAQPEFTALPTKYQLDILLQRGLVVMCVFLCKVNSFDNGMDQLRYGFSQNDEEIWNKKFKAVFHRKELKTLGLFESSHELSFLLSKEQYNCLQKIFEAVPILLKDPIVYGIILLLALSKPVEGANFMGNISKLNSNYNLLMQRRFASSQSKSTEKNPQEIINKVSRSLVYLEQMASILQVLAVAQQSCVDILLSSTS